MQASGSSPRQIIILGLVVVILILGAVLIYVQFNALNSLRTEIEEEEIALIAAQTRLTRLMEHRENASEYEQRLIFANRMIPDQPGEENILRYIQRIAEDNDLRAIEIRFDGRNETESYTAMPLSITVEGSFQDTRQLLDQIQNGERAIRVDDLGLSRAGEAGSLRVSISAIAFYNNNN
ncbi:MAG: type 4a pilus biogenesis protein PilO [Bacillota bacterium]